MGTFFWLTRYVTEFYTKLVEDLESMFMMIFMLSYSFEADLASSRLHSDSGIRRRNSKIWGSEKEIDNLKEPIM